MAKVDEGESRSGLRAAVFLAIAAVGALSASVIVVQMMSAWEEQIALASLPEAQRVVIVAATDLYPGVPITESDIIGVPFPEDQAPEWAVSAAPLIVGRMPQERILANEPIHPARLADATTGEGLNVLVSAGMRAVALDLADGAQLSGHLDPGNIVDVLVTITPEGGQPTTATVAQNVPVLAVNARKIGTPEPGAKKSKRQPRPSAPSVTLMVTPEMAEELTLASSRGQMTLTMRSREDAVEVTVGKIETPDLLPWEKVPEAAPVVKKRRVVQDVTPKLQVCKGTVCTDYVPPPAPKP